MTIRVLLVAPTYGNGHEPADWLADLTDVVHRHHPEARYREAGSFREFVLTDDAAVAEQTRARKARR